MSFTSFRAINGLLEAAQAILDHDSPEARKRLRHEVGKCEEAMQERESFRKYIEEAQRASNCDYVQVDDDALVSPGELGVWVSAWVFIDYDGEDEDE